METIMYVDYVVDFGLVVGKYGGSIVVFGIFVFIMNMFTFLIG